MPLSLRRPFAVSVAVLLIAPSLIRPEAAQALTFTFIADAGTDQRAIDGFTQAGNIWSSFLTDTVNVQISIGFTGLDQGILASADSTQNGFRYTDVRDALTADITSTLDQIAVSNLQTGPALQFVTSDINGKTVLDNDNSINNTFLRINTANAKALGLIPDYSGADAPGQDARIQFSSSYKYDFTHSSTIASDSFDFVGLAVHEIGHALGFISGVDIVDYYSGPNAPGMPFDLNNDPIFNTLDLFRYSSNSDTSIAGFGRVMDLAQGRDVNGDTRLGSYFSVDKTPTSLNFSTGAFDGDGRQASHWKDDQNLGVMDPTAGFGERIDISENDLKAFDAIGWNRVGISAVPEPSAGGLFGMGFLTGGIGLLRRRRSRKGK